MKFISKSEQDTQDIAKNIAKKYQKSGVVIALIGELGAGKTTFTQGFAKALGIKDKIISPTFVLIRRHPLPNQQRYLFHIDLYRLAGKINTKETGLEEILNNSGNIILIEWAEKIKNQLPSNTFFIYFKSFDKAQRIIQIDQGEDEQ